MNKAQYEKLKVDIPTEGQIGQLVQDYQYILTAYKTGNISEKEAISRLWGSSELWLGYHKVNIPEDKRGAMARKALAVIEGSLLSDEPEDKRLCFIYRMAHVGGDSKCEHEGWEVELEEAYQALIKDKIISPLSLISPIDTERLTVLSDEGIMVKIVEWEMLPEHERNHFNLAKAISQATINKGE